MLYVSTVSILILLMLTASPGQEPTSADEYSQRGIDRFQKSDLDGAIADFTKVIEMNGKDQAFCYYFRGMAYYRKSDVNHAIADLSKAIEIKPDPRFLDDRGNLLAKQGELDRALADLNRAIEIAPKSAKAYGDRGLIQLLRGETIDAEADFKKCFELDSALEPQFRAAANQLKQRATASYLHEKPAGAEITKFSWAETLSTALVTASSGAIGVTTSPVSPTGTRILADPNAKGESNPNDIVNPSGITAPIRPTNEDARRFIDYKFSISIKNNGDKTIAGVKWAYFFEPKDPAREGLAYLFITHTDISPGKEKTLTDSLAANTGGGAVMKLPSKRTQKLYNERVAILRLDYTDGTSWRSPADTSRLPPTKPSH